MLAAAAAVGAATALAGCTAIQGSDDDPTLHAELVVIGEYEGEEAIVATEDGHR
ncbi:hypothetical protein [Halovivax sp.]|uniref:hypothetical protein n=1 Tax=Halovivax sp. TaxID=1935978 RepID=UPI0031B8605B